MKYNSKEKQEKWNQAYQTADIASALPALVLTQNDFLLPKEGNALDLACGRAGNAQFLVTKGFDVDAVDSSAIVLKHLKNYVDEKKLPINCILRDIEDQGLMEKKYDVIVISYFLYRALFPQIIYALKPEGLLFYQTWAQPVKGLNEIKGPSNLAFRLQDNELLTLCAPLKILFYQENQSQGDVKQSLRNEAMIVAKNSINLG